MYKEVDLKIARLIIEDNIVLKHYKKDVIIDYEGALEIFEYLTNNLQAGIQYGLLSDIRNIKDLTREARDLYSKAGQFIEYNAILYDVTIQKSLANMFLMFSKPERFKSRIFSKEDEAIIWLKSKV